MSKTYNPGPEADVIGKREGVGRNKKSVGCNKRQAHCTETTAGQAAPADRRNAAIALLRPTRLAAS
jgi:hypothetical protein